MIHKIQWGTLTLLPTVLIDSNTGLILPNPTLTAGDVKISTDFGAMENIDVLPAVDPALSGQVKMSISATEAQCSRGIIIFKDQTSPSEWDELVERFETEDRPYLSGTINDAAASSTVFITTLTSYGDDFFNKRMIVFTSGNLTGISVPISDYDGAGPGDGTITVSPALPAAPDNNSRFKIVGYYG